MARALAAVAGSRRSRNLWMLSALVVSGCAEIKSFTAKPNEVCEGTPIRLAWEANADGVLSADPPDPSLGSVPPTGERLVTPHAKTLYRLDVHRLFGKAARDNTVDVHTAPNVPKTLVGSVANPSAKCDGTTLSVSIETDEKFWDPLLSVNSVVRLGDRPLRVEHGGKTAELSTPDPASVLAGTPVLGVWNLSVRLLPGETCSSDTVPNSLSLRVFTSCQSSTGAPR